MKPLYYKQSKLYYPKTIDEIIKHKKKWHIFSSFPGGTDTTQLCIPAPAPHRWVLPLTNHLLPSLALN